ncbi:UNVERIFIED_CONTAM: hypothetical protein FKN15_050527 [Acipenser sinensis]
MSESGIIDAFVLLGPSPLDVFKQFASLTGPSCFSKCGIKGGAVRVKINELQPIRARYEVPDVLIGEPVTQRSIAQCPAVFLSVSVLPCAGPCSYLDFTSPHVRDWYSSQFALNKYKIFAYIWGTSYSVVINRHLACSEYSMLFIQKMQRRFEHVYGIPEHTDTLRLKNTRRCPPLFSLGYHQSRWNYEDEADVLAVDAGFDQRDIPYDVIWLNIKHTDGKRYFTWDSKRFPDPARLQRHLQRRSRRSRWNYEDEADVLAVDAGFDQRDIPYNVIWLNIEHTDGKRYFTWDSKRFPDAPPLRSSQQHVQGLLRGFSLLPFWLLCLPFIVSLEPLCVLVYYADVGGFFQDPEPELLVRWYQAGALQPFFRGHSAMQTKRREPWLFGDENTRAISNAIRERYRLLQTRRHASAQKHPLVVISDPHIKVDPDYPVYRDASEQGCFVRDRAGRVFEGSCWPGAVWTGDNVASWDYLKLSIPMLLTLSITGISFCGGRVGGFFQDPEPELLVRLYQAGALQPFFRGHSAMETKRREPWLFGDENTRAISNAIRERYRLLPNWYSLFHHTHCHAEPPIRTFRCFEGGTNTSVPVTLDSVPVFQRGGTIVPRKTKAGRSTACLSSIPFDLTVALDSENTSTHPLLGYAIAWIWFGQALYCATL